MRPTPQLQNVQMVGMLDSLLHHADIVSKGWRKSSQHAVSYFCRSCPEDGEKRGESELLHFHRFRQHLTQSTESPLRHPEATWRSPFASHSSVGTAVRVTAYGDHVGLPADCFFSCTCRRAMFCLFLYVRVAAFRTKTIERQTGNQAGARVPPKIQFV